MCERDIWVTWVKAHRVFDWSDRSLGAAEKHQRLTEPQQRVCVVSIEADRHLELDARFVQPVLNPAQCPQYLMSAGIVGVLSDYFQQRLLGAHGVLSRVAAQSEAH